LTLGLTQPLLKGFAFDMAIPRADVLRARFASRRQALDVRSSLLTTIKGTENAYWDLVQALKESEVRRASLELAREQRRLTQKQIDAGILPPSDLIAAESTLAQRELAVVESDAAIGRASDGLRRVLGLSRGEWGRPIQPIDPPSFE